jgi:hypothetical protein
VTEQTLTPAHIADGIRRELATIRRYWPHTFDPPSSAGSSGTGVPDSKMPSNDTAISLRAEVTRDLAYWLHAFADEHPAALDDWTASRGSIDALDVAHACRFLTRHADDLGAWSFGNRLWSELDTLAREVKAVAAPPARDTMALGACPECETVVRAKAHDPGSIRCAGCGTTDTIDGWIIRVVGNEPLVTAEQLVPILHKRMGIVVSQAGIRQWVARKVIPQDSVDERGRARFDRKAVFAALMMREARREGRV